MLLQFVQMYNVFSWDFDILFLMFSKALFMFLSSFKFFEAANLFKILIF